MVHNLSEKRGSLDTTVRHCIGLTVNTYLTKDPRQDKGTRQVD